MNEMETRDHHRVPRRGQKTLILMATIALLLLSVSSASAAVTLASFTATGQIGQVLLEWETASEINNIGFNLWRSTNEMGDYAKLNDAIIPSQALGSVIGATYSYVDADVVAGTTYYYKLESIAADGSSEFHGPVSATPEAPPTATPTITETPTPSPTATEIPTATPLPSLTATEIPTATPRPSRTPTRRPPSSPRATKTPTPTHSPTREPTSTPIPTNIPAPTATSSPTSTALATRAPTTTPLPTLTATRPPTATPPPPTPTTRPPTPSPEVPMAAVTSTPTALRLPQITPTAQPSPRAEALKAEGSPKPPVQRASSLGDRLAARTLWLGVGLLAGLGAWLVYGFILGRR